LFACSKPQKKEPSPLPYLGQKTVKDTIIDGKDTTVNIPYTIPPFAFENITGDSVTNTDLTGKVYVANFFFTTCRTVCPTMQGRLYDLSQEFSNTELRYISHTLDPENDTKSVLKEYAKGLGADTSKWFFLRAEEDYTYHVANEMYLAAARIDENNVDGISHTGKLILVDKNQHIRGFYDNNDPDDLKVLYRDISKLLNEEK
jgi:protein SCO1/2